MSNQQNQTTLIPSSNVEGNITSCKIENQVKAQHKQSMWSTQQQTTYITYDVCNKKVIAEYTKPEATGMLFVWIALIILVLGFVLLVIRLIKWDGKEYGGYGGLLL